ncbi:MAG: HAMP domain-containing histidine kinase [Armatimonadetes bacterium]|nr:HAMP domain-containing histidine kinase [Armatimonadota bacterium]
MGMRKKSAPRRLLRSVSHDLNNLITVIRGYGRLAQLSPSSAVLSDCLERIMSTTHCLETLAEDLERCGHGDRCGVRCVPTAFPMEGAIRAAARSVLFDSALHRIEVEETPLRVRADRKRVVQVLVNLLGNAVKYSPRGGVVRVAAARQGSMVHVAVHDEGIGIEPSELGKVMRPFYRVPNEDIPGTGLGLAIARSLVEAHGGQLWLESAPGQGTTAHFTLPEA